MSYITKIELKADKTVGLGQPNNPTSIEGYYLGHQEITGDYGTTKLHVFVTAEGNVGVWGKAHLNKLLSNDHIGQRTKVSFVGMKEPFKKGRKPSYQFSLQYDPQDLMDTSGVILGSSGEDGNSRGDNLSDADYPRDEENEFVERVTTTRPTGHTSGTTNSVKLGDLLNKSRTSTNTRAN